MQSLDWGIFFNKYGLGRYDPKKPEAMIVELLDDNVTKHSVYMSIFLIVMNDI
jgi:hypothetical protein